METPFFSDHFLVPILCWVDIRAQATLKKKKKSNLKGDSNTSSLGQQEGELVTAKLLLIVKNNTLEQC